MAALGWLGNLGFAGTERQGARDGLAISLFLNTSESVNLDIRTTKDFTMFLDRQSDFTQRVNKRSTFILEC
jgi:hypothetical protein